MISNNSPAISDHYIGQQQGNEVNSLQKVENNSLEASVKPSAENISTSDRKSNVVEILSKNHTDVQALSSAFKQEFSQNTLIQGKINFFKENFSENINTVQKQSWNELKAERGLDMTKPVGDESASMADFRDAANTLVDEITTEIGRELGLPKVEWSACGTVGFDSDVDTALKTPKEGINSDDACLYKTVRDTVHTSIFDGLSGVQLDTESYIPHPSELNTTKNLSNSQESRQKYTTHEMTNIALQRYESLAQHPEKYQESKLSDINSISNPQQKEAMKVIYEQVEVFMEYIEDEIADKVLEQNNIPKDGLNSVDKRAAANEIVKKDPQAYKNAREITIIPLRMALAKKCGAIEGKIKAKEKQLEGNHVAGSEVMKLDNLHLERNKTYTLLALLQDQGTHSQAEGKVTLFKEGGQIHAGKQKQAKKQVSKKIKQSSALHRKVLNHAPNTARNPITDKLFLNNLRRSSLPEGFEKPDTESLLLASYEESIQYEHVVDDGLSKISEGDKASDVNLVGKVAISSGKYCLRTCRNNLRALDEMKKTSQENDTPLPKNFNEMMGRAKKLHFKATQLEQCKRKNILNKTATVELLAEAIVNDGKDNGEKATDEVKLRSDLEKVMDLFEYGGTYDNTALRLSEKTEIMMTELEQRGHIELQEISDEKGVKRKQPKNPDVRRILQARAGYSRGKEKHKDLIQVHQQGDRITISKLNLSSPHQVSKFASQVIRLGQDIRNHAISENILTTPNVEEARSMDFMDIAMESLINK